MALKHPFPATVFKSRFPRVFSGISPLLLTAAALNAPAHAQNTSSSVSLTFSGKKVTYQVSSEWVAFQLKSASTRQATIQGLSELTALDSATKPSLVGTDIVALRVASSATAYSKTQLTTRLKNATSIQRQLRVFNSGTSPIIETTDAIINFKDGVTDAQRKTLLQKQGAILVGPIGSWSPNSYRVRVSSANAYASNVANALLSSGSAKWANPNLAYRIDKAATTNDPMFSKQWHLSNNGVGGTVNADIKALKAWDTTLGSGVKLCINDDGIDIDHEDLKAQYLIGRDFESKTDDPRPRTEENNHGTSVAGLALAAGNNGIGVSGVAPGAKLIAARIPLGGAVTLDTIAESLVWPAQQGADIISCSWGGAGFDNGVLPEVIGDAITYVTTKGRNGKGTILLYSAGNDNRDSKNGINYHPNVITVTATTRSDKKSSYSNFGPDVDVAAPGGPIPGDMVTTDRTGGVGYSEANYTEGFNGTSAACPVAAGVVALMLSVNPEMTREQVYTILTQSAEKIDKAGGNYNANGRSNIYGFGRVDAYQAVVATKLAMGAQVGITTPEARAEYDRGELTEATGTTDDRAASVNAGLVRTDSNGKRLAYLNFETGAWVSMATTNSTVGMYAANFDNGANTWQKDIPDNVLGGGYYQFLAQGFTAEAVGGAVATSNFKVDLIDVIVSTPTINTEYSSGTSNSSYVLLPHVTGTADEDATNVGVALIKKNAAGQSVYHWDFSAADQTANNWIPLNRDTMMTPATFGVTSGNQVNWDLSMPTLGAGKYEVRVQATDSAGVDGELTSVPFGVVATDGLPESLTLTPVSVKVAAGKAVAFKATYRHTIANSKMKFLFFRAQMGEGDGATTIQVRYDIANNVVSIYDSAAARWVNGYQPGTKVTVTATIADLNVRQCKFTQPKAKKSVEQPMSFTFSIIPKVSGTYVTAIRCGTGSVFSDWVNKGVMTVTAGKSVRSNSLDPTEPSEATS